jgi:hypothetical protein
MNRNRVASMFTAFGSMPMKTFTWRNSIVLSASSRGANGAYRRACKIAPQE